jgi:hypothetical protein
VPIELQPVITAELRYTKTGLIQESKRLVYVCYTLSAQLFILLQVEDRSYRCCTPRNLSVKVLLSFLRSLRYSVLLINDSRIKSASVLLRILHDECFHGTRGPMRKLSIALESDIEDLDEPGMITLNIGNIA